MTMQNQKEGQKGDNGGDRIGNNKDTCNYVRCNEGGVEITTPEREEQEESSAEISVETTVNHTHEGKSLVILQVN
jgi:hypothetical protein